MPRLAEIPPLLLRTLEAVGVAALLGLLRLLPLDRSAGLSAFLCRHLGPRLGISRRALANLHRAFPEKPEAEIQRILRAMWDHHGRVFAEYAHLDSFRLYTPESRVEVVNPEYVDRLREDGKPGIFFSGHIGNWELASMGVLHRGLPISLIYRAPNNPFVHRLLRAVRGVAAIELLPKGAKGGKRAIEIMREGGHLGMLVDQKMNDGIPVPFFGREAMTAPALARLALKFDCPVVPTRVERLHGSRFRLTFYPPLELERSGNTQRDVAHLMARANKILEDWIRERPEQWLWLHRRWPD
ncbi:MAG TPA: lipid A biosynthesis lauroyl acyltransferase [Alphaproteobacteria bacterium]|nr:lipid A biosynthesis lauroyl acyltransferase [Alphaproteobacteria bacterium]